MQVFQVLGHNIYPKWKILIWFSFQIWNLFIWHHHYATMLGTIRNICLSLTDFFQWKKNIEWLNSLPIENAPLIEINLNLQELNV